MVEMAMFIVQRAVTPKAGKPEFCSSSHEALNLCGFIKISEMVSNLLSSMKIYGIA